MFGGEEIALRQHVVIAVPQFERGILDRRGAGDPGIGDEHIQPAEFAGAGRRRQLATCASSVTSQVTARTTSLPNCLANPARTSSTAAPSRSASITQAPSFSSRAAVAAPIPPAPPVTSAILPDHFLGRGHPLQLGFFEQPVFDIEGFLLIQRDIVADGFGAAHHVDGIEVEFARDPRGGLVAGEGDAAHARHQHHHRIGIAHGGRIGPFAASHNRRRRARDNRRALRQIGLVRQLRGIEHQRGDLGAQEVIGAACAQRRQPRKIGGIDEFDRLAHRRRNAPACGARPSSARAGAASARQQWRRGSPRPRPPPRQRPVSRPACG